MMTDPNYGKARECLTEFREAAELGQVLDPKEIIRIFRMYLSHSDLRWLCDDLALDEEAS